jgi:Flp pilus assembly protein TadD
LDWNWAAADTSFATAVSWKPGDARLHEWRGLFLALRGDTRAGVVEMERALALDPRSPSMGTGLGRLLSFDGQDERAIMHLQQVVREHPQYAEAHCALGLAYGYAGRTAESIASLERAVSLSDRRPVILANLGYTLARAGRRPEALAILSELDSLSRIRPISPWVRSMVHFGLGEIDRGLDLMQESLDQGEGLLAYVKVEPMPPEVRSHPRFQEMIRQIGLQP